jgi:hypothetical protein
VRLAARRPPRSMAGAQKWVLRGRPGAHPAGGPQVALFYWARRAGSVGKGVFVVRGWIDIVTRFVGVWTPHALWRWWWRNARAVRNHLRRQPSVADAAHLVGVPAVVADHLDAGSGICWVMAARKSVAVKTSKLRLILALSRER